MKNNSTGTIKEVLMNELDSLVKGETSIKRANAVSKLSAQAIYATRVELENKRAEINIGHLFGQVRWDKIDGIEVTIPKITMTKG